MSVAISARETVSVSTAGRRRVKLGVIVSGLALLVAALGSLLASPASADEVLIPIPGPPVAVSGGEYSYIATPGVTRQIDGMNMPRAIASLPLPKQYQPANLAFAARFDVALAGARATRGACLQVVVDPKPADGGFFNYGFFPVAPAYCA